MNEEENVNRNFYNYQLHHLLNDLSYQNQTNKNRRIGFIKLI